MNKIKIACFGLQGFGNDLLEALRENERAVVVGIYTRLQNFEFKYYDCPPIEQIASDMQIPLFHIPEKGDWNCGKANLAIVSSFHRILKPKHLDSFERVINIHPSLLPSYKGATPTNWMAKNGETIVGITAHAMDEGIDTGEILTQRELLNPYLNDNELRKALSFASRKVVADIVAQFPNYKTLKNITHDGSYFPPRNNEDAILKYEELSSINQLIFHIKAFTNFPMPKLLINGRIFIIDYKNPTDEIEIELENQKFGILGYWSESS